MHYLRHRSKPIQQDYCFSALSNFLRMIPQLTTEAFRTNYTVKFIFEGPSKDIFRTYSNKLDPRKEPRVCAVYANFDATPWHQCSKIHDLRPRQCQFTDDIYNLCIKEYDWILVLGQDIDINNIPHLLCLTEDLAYICEVQGPPVDNMRCYILSRLRNYARIGSISM